MSTLGGLKDSVVQYDPFADAEEIEVDVVDEVDEVTKSKKQNTTFICNFTTYTKKSPNA